MPMSTLGAPWNIVVNHISENPEFNPYPNKPRFLRVCSTSLAKTLWGKKEKLLVTSNFSFSHSVFHPFDKLSAVFIKLKIVVRKLFSVWKSLKSVVWERVKRPMGEHFYNNGYHRIPDLNDQQGEGF